MVKEIRQYAELWTSPEELAMQVRRAARAGRVCYQSEGKTSDKDFLLRIIAKGHESVLEHISFTFSLITNRAVTHQLVRHRIGVAYSQESQRYCRYDDKLQVIVPEVEGGLTKEQHEAWSNAMLTCALAYDAAIAKEGPMNFKPEVARGVLPNDTKTQIVVTFNLRSFRHFLKLRLDKHAQYQIRNLATKMLVNLEDTCYDWFAEGIDLSGRTDLTH